MARKKKNTVKVDFSDTSVRQNFAEGDYVGTLSGIERRQNDDNDGILFMYEISGGTKDGKTLEYYCSLKAEALWKLRQHLEDHGVETEESAMTLDLDEIAEEIGDVEWDIVVTHTGEGGKYTNVSVFERDPDASDDDDDNDDGEEDDLPDEDEINEMDEDELEELVDDHGLEVNLSKIKGIKKKRKAIIEAVAELADDDGDDDDGDDDGEDATFSKDEIMSMKAKELEELVEEHELDVELEGKIRAKRKAVIEALEEEGMLED